MKNYYKILIKSELFQKMNESEIEHVLKRLCPQKNEYKKNDYIYYYGKNVSSIGIVLNGSVHIIKEDYWGNRTIIAEISEGQLFGEAYACLETKVLFVSVLAAQNSTILFINVNTILNEYSYNSTYHMRLLKNLINVLANKNIYLTNKINYMSQRKLRDKILTYLSDISEKKGISEFTIPFNRQELADYLSVDRSALSNEICKLRDEGILEFHKNQFKLISRKYR